MTNTEQLLRSAERIGIVVTEKQEVPLGMGDNKAIRAGEFAIWLNSNRWFNFEKGKWRYTFEHGTMISKKSYEKNYSKTHEELYGMFLKERYID